MFVLLRILPGDPADVLLEGNPFATSEMAAQLRAQWHLDKPIYEQYFIWLQDLLRGDLGRSLYTMRPVIGELIPRYWATIQLSVVSILIAASLGLVLGVASAVKRGTLLDVLTSISAVAGVSMPSFWFALLLMMVFAVYLGWLPVAGSGTPAHLILPAVTLGFGTSLAVITRMTRSSMIDVLSQDYIRTARAKGCSESSINYKHALRNALIPVITVIGLQFGYLLAGQVITETIFAWPGIGRLMVSSIMNRDFPVLQGAVIFIALTFVLVNLLVDILYAILDPRLKLG
jgi:peptide/nickel transport system permease protein/oligopeptide transport system permease protein